MSCRLTGKAILPVGENESLSISCELGFGKHMLEMNLFQNHVKNFENIVQIAKDKISRNVLINDRSRDLSDIVKHLEEAQELLEQIELEVRDMPSNERYQMELYVTQNKSQLTQLNQQYKNLRSASLSRYTTNDIQHGDHDERQKLLVNMEKLDECSDHLDHGYKLALESEKVGSAILDDLKSQRESLQRSHQRLRDMNTDLGKSSRILTGMMRRILQNRIVTGAVGVFVLLVIVITIWLAKEKT